jgi:hypothetical protein
MAVDEFEDHEADEIGADFGGLTVVEDGALVDPTAPLGESEDQRRELALRTAQTVRDLRARDNELNVELARSLFEIKASALYMYITNEATGEPYTSFKDYIAEEVNFSLRRADYYAAIYRWFAVQHSADFLAHMAVVPFHKLKELAGLVEPDTAQSWIDLALNPAVSTIEFKAEVSKAKEKLKGDDKKEMPMAPVGAIADPLKSVTFKLNPIQHERVNKALALAQTYGGTDEKGQMLEVLAECYIEQIESQDQNAEDEVPLVTKLLKIEREHGVKLVAINSDDESGPQIVHGMAALQAALGNAEDEAPAEG